MWCHDSNMYADSTECTCFISLAFSGLNLILCFLLMKFSNDLATAQLDSSTREGNF